MSKPDKLGDLEEIFEILVTSYTQRGGTAPRETEMCWRPPTDAYETADTFVVQIELAGLDPAQIQILADQESLTVRGVRQDISPPGKKHFHEMEISVGPYARRVPLIPGVDPNSAVAHYRNGFLYITFKKGSADHQVSRRIAVDH